MSLNEGKRSKLIEEFGHHPRDTGSSEVQVALLTEEIKHLTKHMETHKKDFRSQRSLIIMVSRRQRHLKYLKKTTPERYRMVVQKLGLRK